MTKQNKFKIGILVRINPAHFRIGDFSEMRGTGIVIKKVFNTDNVVWWKVHWFNNSHADCCYTEQELVII